MSASKLTSSNWNTSNSVVQQLSQAFLKYTYTNSQQGVLPNERPSKQEVEALIDLFPDLKQYKQAYLRKNIGNLAKKIALETAAKQGQTVEGK